MTSPGSGYAGASSVSPIERPPIRAVAGSVAVLQENEMVIMQSAFLVFVVVGILALLFTMGWVTIYNYLADRRGRLTAARAPVRRPKVAVVAANLSLSLIHI